MFIPLHDRNDLDHINLQYVTFGLIVNTVIWLGTTFSGETGAFTTAAVLGFGYIPAVANGFADLAPDLAIVPEEATHTTYAFLHGGFWHLASNMLFLWVFGDNIEDALGRVRFLIFYLLCAAAGALAMACWIRNPKHRSSVRPAQSLASPPPTSSCIPACGSGFWCSVVFRCRFRPSFRLWAGSAFRSSWWFQTSMATCHRLPTLAASSPAPFSLS